MELTPGYNILGHKSDLGKIKKIEYTYVESSTTYTFVFSDYDNTLVEDPRA